MEIFHANGVTSLLCSGIIDAECVWLSFAFCFSLLMELLLVLETSLVLLFIFLHCCYMLV